MIAVALTHFHPSGEHTRWVNMPAVPRVGEAVSVRLDDGDYITLHVRAVLWSQDNPEHPVEFGISDDEWCAEVTLGAKPY